METKNTKRKYVKKEKIVTPPIETSFSVVQQSTEEKKVVKKRITKTKKDVVDDKTGDNIQQIIEEKKADDIQEINSDGFMNEKMMNDTLNEIMKQINELDNKYVFPSASSMSSSSIIKDATFDMSNGKHNSIPSFIEEDEIQEPDTKEKKEGVKDERIKMLEERGDFLDLRLIEPHDYYKGFLELLTELDNVDPIDIIQFTTYVINLHKNYKQIWVVEDKRYNVIVGTVTLVLETNLFNKMGKYCRVEDLIVHHGIRKYGLGRTLVNHIFKIAREISCYKVVMNCKDNLVHFCENCGFEKDRIEMSINVTPTTVFRLEHDLLNHPDPFDT